MHKRIVIISILIYVVIVLLNWLTPLFFGDDYVDAFIWTNLPMGACLPENVERINSFNDLLESALNHYLWWSGRAIAQFAGQLFIWSGKNLFNFFNALVFVLLNYEIQWISDEGQISFRKLDAKLLCLTFFVFWAFTADFSIVFLWLLGATNYVWPITVVVLFLTFYIRKYFNMEKILFLSKTAKYYMFFLGMLAGWTNENTICWIILGLAIWIYKNKNVVCNESWLIWGWFGLCFGYSILMLAPGNAVRTAYVTGDSFIFLTWSAIKTRLQVLEIVMLFQVFLWYFIITSLRKIDTEPRDGIVLKYVNLSKYFCLLSVLSNVIMLIAPDFQPRSGFPSLVFLTIAFLLVLRVQSVTNRSFINYATRKFLFVVGCGYFVVTLLATYLGIYRLYQYRNYVNEMAVQHYITGQSGILEIKKQGDFPKRLWWASGFHLISNELSDDENNWKNVAFSRFHNIKSVRVIK